MNYQIINGCYEADDGYMFRHKITGVTFRGMHLADGDSIENYEVVPIPEPEPEEKTELSEPEETLSEDEMTAEDAVNELLEVINNG